MKNKSFVQYTVYVYLLSIATIFSAAFAPTTPIECIQQMGVSRTNYFNTKTDHEIYTRPKTNRIDTIVLSKNVNTEVRMDNPDKKIFIQSIMARAIIHGNESVYAHHGLRSDDRRFKHFEIIRLTELFAVDLLKQSEYGFIDCDILTEYSNLYTFSGKSKNTYKQWFEEMLETNKGGLYKRVVSRINKVMSQLPKKSMDHDSQNIIFGNIPVHGVAERQIPFISTYHMRGHQLSAEQKVEIAGILVKLPNHTLHQHYIHIEPPYFDEDNDSPYTLRLHPVVHPDANAHTHSNTDVHSQIRAGKNKTTTITINDSDKSVQTHDGTFSPNNKHLHGFPRRPLNDDETFSFVSVNTWDRQRMEVFHLLTTNQEYLTLFSESLTQYRDFYTFLQKLTENVYTHANWAYYKPHLHKMLAFIEGRLD